MISNKKTIDLKTNIKMRKTLMILLVCLITSCNGQDFSLKDSLIQAVPIKGAKHLIIECYCENEVVIEKTKNTDVTIEVSGILKSEGYHGEQNKPDNIEVKTLSFIPEKKGDTLKIISREWVFMHHSYLIDKLKITVPESMSYKIEKIAGNTLEGRKIE